MTTRSCDVSPVTSYHEDTVASPNAGRRVGSTPNGTLAGPLNGSSPRPFTTAETKTPAAFPALPEEYFIPDEEGGPAAQEFSCMIVVQAFADNVHPDECQPVSTQQRAHLHVQIRAALRPFGRATYFDEVDPKIPSNCVTAWFIMENLDNATRAVLSCGGLIGRGLYRNAGSLPKVPVKQKLTTFRAALL